MNDSDCMNRQTTLDQMVADDRCQMMKAAIPYLPPSGRRFLSLYAKLLELSNTAALFSGNQGLEICSASRENADPMAMIEDIRSYCHGENRRKMDEMINLMAMFEIIQVMNEP